MIERHNEDGSITFMYESWDEFLKQEPKWQPDPDLAAKDRADERIAKADPGWLRKSERILWDRSPPTIYTKKVQSD